MPRPLEGVINYSYPHGHSLRYPTFGLGDADLYPDGSGHVDVEQVARVLVELIKEFEKLHEFVEACLPVVQIERQDVGPVS